MSLGRHENERAGWSHFEDLLLFLTVEGGSGEGMRRVCWVE